MAEAGRALGLLDPTSVTHGLLLVDKPRGLSVARRGRAVRARAFDTRRVGHAGTLDPMATGVLVLAVGEGLKVLRYLTLDDKRYAATRAARRRDRHARRRRRGDGDGGGARDVDARARARSGSRDSSGDRCSAHRR